MSIDNTLRTNYKINYYSITFGLLLSVSPFGYAQQLPCNPTCSNTTADYISEVTIGGIFNLDDITLIGNSPNSADYSNVTLALGRDTRPVGNLELNADALKIHTASNEDSHGRAIALGSSTNNATVTANLTNSIIEYESANNANGYNTIGLLMESDASGQIYNINLKNTNMSISSDADNNVVGGIWVYSANGFAETNITLDNSNIVVESSLDSAYGIRTENRNNPSNSIISIKDIKQGSINVTGYTSAYGISIDTEGESADIDIKSNINVEAIEASSRAYGIYTRTQKNTIATNANQITVKGGSQVYGISVVGDDDQEVISSAEIKVESSGDGVGIQAQSNSGNVKIDTTNNIVVDADSTAYGIYASAWNNAEINVAGKLDTSNSEGDGVGIYSNTDVGFNEIRLKENSNVIGGGDLSGFGIYMQSKSGDQLLTLEKNSQLSSASDFALQSYSMNGEITVDNYGTIIGYAELSSGGAITFNNYKTGVLDLKNITSSGKNTVAVIIDSPDGLLNNEGLIKFSAEDNFNKTISEAVFIVDTFKNSGLIDLTGKNPKGENSLVGDTFNIYGNYISNGGTIYLNTLLDDALSNGGFGTSDLIIIDQDVITEDGGPTKLIIIPTSNSLGALTVGDGIKVVHVAGDTSDNAFVLGKRLVSGAYEYTLHEGNEDSNWYLSSYAIDIDKTGTGEIQYNPAVGAYLANQTAAVQMFQQSLFDRLISSSDGKNNDASKSLFWMRTKMTHGSYDSVHGGLNNRTRSYSLQMGGDLNVWALNNGGYFHLGVMGGYGDFKDTSKSNTTGTKTDGKVKGYSAGVYGTYFANEDTNLGLYVDLWSQMGWYRNEVSGEAQTGTKKYNSTVWSNSVELGYGIPLAVSGEYQWLATPQAQFTYNSYEMDNQYDKNNLYVSNNNASGLDTRLGVRFHARGVEDSLIEPFLEMNWLSTTAKNSLDFNGKSISDGFAKDRFEAKVGLQGDINKRWSVSAQVGGQWGNNSYNNYQGQLNISYKF